MDIMDSVDMRLFIEEVHKRPSLWDSSVDLYKCRDQKKTAWEEVSAALFPDFYENDENEKAQLSKVVQMKWRHVRDAYVRQNRLTRRRKKSPFSKPYVYSKQLEFLNPIIDAYQNTKPFPRSEQNTDDSKDSTTDYDPIDASQDIPENNTEKHEVEDADDQTSRLFKHFRVRKKLLEEDVISEVDPPSMNPDEEQYKETSSYQEPTQQEHTSDDMAFFTSLLPSLQTLRPDQKLLFRIDVMKLLASYSGTPQQNSRKANTLNSSQAKTQFVSVKKRRRRSINESEDGNMSDDSIMSLYSE